MATQKKIKRYRHRAITMFLLFVISAFVFEYAILEIQSQREHQQESLQERNFDVIWDFLMVCNKIGYQDSKKLAETMENTIKEEYDLDELEEKLNNGDSKEFVSTLNGIVSDFESSSLVKNNRNSVIILEGSDKILVDRMIDVSKIDTTKSHTKFSDYYDLSINPNLFTTAKRQVLNQTSTTPIMLEVHDYGQVKNHMLIESSSYENLKKVYMKEGVLGLHNYQFLCPSYITKDGDIFGNVDIDQGNPKENHKFTVICTFNLYDQLIQMRPDFGDSEYYDHLDFGFDRILSSVYLAAFVAFLVFFIIIVFYVKAYNDAVIEYLGERALEESESDDHPHQS